MFFSLLIEQPSYSISVQNLDHVASSGQKLQMGSLSQIWKLDHVTPIMPALGGNYRHEAAKRQTAGIKFTHRPKIRFFTPLGRLVAPIKVKLGRADGHMGPLGYAKFRLNRQRGGVEMRPQNIKHFHFLVRSRGDSLDRFPKFLEAFIRLSILR